MLLWSSASASKVGIGHTHVEQGVVDGNAARDCAVLDVQGLFLVGAGDVQGQGLGEAVGHGNGVVDGTWDNGTYWAEELSAHDGICGIHTFTPVTMTGAMRQSPGGA
jgi:hypothetical protein